MRPQRGEGQERKRRRIPRKICICGKFRAQRRYPLLSFDSRKCENCHGYMSRERLVEMGYIYDFVFRA